MLKVGTIAYMPPEILKSNEESVPIADPVLEAVSHLPTSYRPNNPTSLACSLPFRSEWSNSCLRACDGTSTPWPSPTASVGRECASEVSSVLEPYLITWCMDLHFTGTDTSNWTWSWTVSHTRSGYPLTHQHLFSGRRPFSGMSNEQIYL